MSTFQYKAMKSDGEMTSGELQAPDQSTAVAMLQNLGHIPIQVKEASSSEPARVKAQASRFKRRSKAFPMIDFTRDLATLLRSGVSLENAMVMLVDLAETESAHNLLSRVLEKVRGGEALSDALSSESSVFNRFYVNMIRAGEEGGALDSVLLRLSEFLDQYDSLKRSVQTALIYPLILMVVTLLSLMILMVVVVPQFQVLFEDMGQELPFITQVVIAVGDVVSQWWWLALLVFIAAGYWLRKRLDDPVFRMGWDSRLLKLPLLGELVVRMQVAIFSRTLSTLLSSGVTLLRALTIVKETMTNKVIARKLGEAAEQVREGEYLADSLARVGGFPRLVEHLVRVGEESGELESTLVQLADIYDREVRVTIQRMLALLEPVLIIGLGLVIGGIIASILVAILSVNDLAL